MAEVDQSKLDESLGQAFKAGQLRFCHDPSYELRPRDRALCPLSEAELQRCPALQRECRAASGKKTQPEKRTEPASLPPWVSNVAEGLFWVMVVGVLVGVVLTIWRLRRRRDEVADESEQPGPGELGQAEASQAHAPGDTNVQRLLEKARRAAERGELGEAIDAAHAAAIQGLSASGHIAIEPDRTNGDYLRELRKTPPLQKDFKVIVGEVEVAQFGGVMPSRSSFELVLAQVVAMLRRLAVLSLLALGLVGCSSPNEGEESSPSGLYAFKRLLAGQGLKVHTRVAPITGKLQGVGEIVLFPTSLEDPVEKHLLRWVEDGGSLILVENSTLAEASELQRVEEGCGTKAERGPNQDLSPLRLVVLGKAFLRSTSKPDSIVEQRVDASCGSPAKPYIVTSFVGDGAITYIPERELLTNASLSVGDNAQLVAELFAIEEGSVELVGPWTGDGAESPVQALKAAGMMPFMLQLFAVALLLALRQGTSFGARRDKAIRERRAFADHVRAVGSTYARARAGRLVSGHYGLLLIEQLRERCCPGQAPTLLQLAAAIARRSGRPETEVVQLLVEAKSSFETSAEGSDIDHALITRLEKISLQVGGVS